MCFEEDSFFLVVVGEEEKDFPLCQQKNCRYEYDIRGVGGSDQQLKKRSASGERYAKIIIKNTPFVQKFSEMLIQLTIPS